MVTIDDISQFDYHSHGADQQSLYVDTDTQSDRFEESYGSQMLQRNGHILSIDADGVSCVACDTEKEVPSLVRESSDHRATVYRLYLIGQFDHESCDRQDQVIAVPGTGVTSYEGPIHWSNTTTGNNSTAHHTVSEEEQKRIAKRMQST